MGTGKLRRMVEDIIPMVEGRIGDKKNIFRSKPHFKNDNDFSGEPIYKWMVHNGFGLTMILRRKISQKYVPRKYLHKNGTGTSNNKKAARFFETVVEVKDVDSDDINEVYTRVHVYF